MKRSGPKPQGDPLVIVMQIDEQNKKLDQILEGLKGIAESLARIEARQLSGLEAIKEGPVKGSFGSSELPPDTKD